MPTTHSEVGLTRDRRDILTFHIVTSLDSQKSREEDSDWRAEAAIRPCSDQEHSKKMVPVEESTRTKNRVRSGAAIEMWWQLPDEASKLWESKSLEKNTQAGSSDVSR